MTDQQYQASYYQRVTKDRRRGRWATDTDYREGEQQRAKRRRALQRARVADERFDQMVQEKRKRLKRTQVPRDVLIDDEVVRCYSSGSLAREIGREGRTIRLWLAESVLPGATIFFSVDTIPDAYFSEGFCAAVKRAARRLYRLDARFPRDKLRGLILEELMESGESYMPLSDVGEEGRVRLCKRVREKVS